MVFKNIFKRHSSTQSKYKNKPMVLKPSASDVGYKKIETKTSVKKKPQEVDRMVVDIPEENNVSDAPATPKVFQKVVDGVVMDVSDAVRGSGDEARESAPMDTTPAQESVAELISNPAQESVPEPSSEGTQDPAKEVSFISSIQRDMNWLFGTTNNGEEKAVQQKSAQEVVEEEKAVQDKNVEEKSVTAPRSVERKEGIVPVEEEEVFDGIDDTEEQATEETKKEEQSEFSVFNACQFSLM